MTFELSSGGSCVLRKWPTVKLIALVGAAFAFGGSTIAQAPPVPPGGTVVAAGLQGPRGLTFGPDGLLYIAEAGTGGTQPVPAGAPMWWIRSGLITAA